MHPHAEAINKILEDLSKVWTEKLIVEADDFAIMCQDGKFRRAHVTGSNHSFEHGSLIILNNFTVYIKYYNREDTSESLGFINSNIIKGDYSNEMILDLFESHDINRVELELTGTGISKRKECYINILKNGVYISEDLESAFDKRYLNKIKSARK